MKIKHTSFLLPYQQRIQNRNNKIGRYFMGIGFIFGLVFGILI
jgi:hypothetical protein|tara:strand:- start:147 stop:275 length:129 start_codon:yes stop_codon:yes gene_type:complete